MRTNDKVDRFYQIDTDKETVKLEDSRNHNHNLWDRLNDTEKNFVVSETRLKGTTETGLPSEVNSKAQRFSSTEMKDGMQKGDQSKIAGTVAPKDGQVVYHAYANPNSVGSKLVSSKDPIPAPTITDRDAPQGALPTPAEGQSAKLQPGSLPKNISTMPELSGNRYKLTDEKGNLVKKLIIHN